MQLLDFKSIANVTFFSGFKDYEYDQDKFKHQFLNYVLYFNERFRKEYGEMVICLDSKGYWRRDFFEHYKAGRKKARDSSGYDFAKVYENFNSLTEDLRNHIPWKVIEAKRAEADDIIGVLAKAFHVREKIMIISSDKDFLQLQQYHGVAQYSPYTKNLIKSEKPLLELREKIIRGDAGDGIPNCKSPAHVLVTDGIKQERVMSKWLTPLLESQDFMSLMTAEEQEGYRRNEKLIDLNHTPKEIAKEIVLNFMITEPAPRGHVYKYLQEKGYVNLFEQINSF